jgi:hypothetical protein
MTRMNAQSQPGELQAKTPGLTFSQVRSPVGRHTQFVGVAGFEPSTSSSRTRSAAGFMRFTWAFRCLTGHSTALGVIWG